MLDDIQLSSRLLPTPRTRRPTRALQVVHSAHCGFRRGSPFPMTGGGTHPILGETPTQRPLLLRLGALAASICLGPALLEAQGVIAGRITARTDSGVFVPAPGATVTVVGTLLGAVTGADGRFVIPGVPESAFTVRIRHLGYRTTDRLVRVRNADTVRVDLVLQSEAQLLAPVRTAARSGENEMFESKPNVATIVMNAAAMAGVPSVGEPDVIRTVQLLPGVVARNDFNTGLNVRGGEADQNLVLLDGHPIYNPFHFGGVFSTFMDATVGTVELMTGAFPARFGGRLSAILDVRSAEDARPDLHATADVSALGATGRVAGGFGGGRGSWSFAGRRTYADAVQSVFTKNIFPYHFRDFHGRATYVLTNGTRIAFTGYAGKDVLDANLAEFESGEDASKAGRGAWSFNWGNLVLGASIAKDIGRSTTVEQRLSTSGFSTTLDLGDGAFSQNSSIRDLRLAGSVVTRGRSHDRTVGYDLATHRIRYASNSAQTGTTDFDLVQRPVFGAAWVDDLWRVSTKWMIEGGLRAEALSGRGWAALSPRLSVKYFASPNIAVTAAGGRVTQWLHSFAGDGPLRYFDIWIASDSFIPVAAAWHGVVGVEQRWTSQSLKIEGYYKRFDRVMEANWGEDVSRRGDEFFVAGGSSYGLDMLARWQLRRRIGGWVAYTYGVSRRSRDQINWTPPGHDRRHDVDVVTMYRFRKYRVGSRFGYATGTPYTPILGQIVRRVYDPSRDRWGTGDPRLFTESLGGQRNSARYPVNHRLDLDISREFHRGTTTISPYVSVANAYNAKNVFVYLYNYSTDAPTRRAISQFPTLPSLGVRVAF